MSRPSISVIVPVWNGERFLVEALESVLAHAVVDEVVVVDDGSTDGTADLVRRYPVAYRWQPRQGVAAARNLGLASITGTIVGFLDADDRWASPTTAGEARLARLLRDSAVDLVLGMTQVFRAGEGGEEKIGPPRAILSLGPMLARREVFAKVGGFDPAFHTGEDLDWFARAREQGCELAWVDATVQWYRRHPGTLTSDGVAQDRGVLNTARAAIARRRTAVPSGDAS